MNLLKPCVDVSAISVGILTAITPWINPIVGLLTGIYLGMQIYVYWPKVVARFKGEK